MTVACVLSLLTLCGVQKAKMQDELLNLMVGKWHITREFPKRKAENTATIEWVLNDHWLRIDMKDIEKPSQYEAHVYITQMVSDKSYAIHWHDSFGGTLPEVLGTGHRVGDSIVFSFKDPDGELRNTFAWHGDRHEWTSKIEQTDKAGKWTVFCTDTYRKVSPTHSAGKH